MVDRNLKIVFSVALGAMALLYVLHNVANWGAAYDFFVYTTSHADHEGYPVDLLPVPGDALIYPAMLLVFALEFGAAGYLFWGGWKMWQARKGDAQAFGAAKNVAKIGCGLAVANWWGLFQAIAVAGYQLWQSPIGEGPFYGSFFFGAMNMALLIYLNQKEA